MRKTLGYLLTWTTYGTWLQGDERGYVKNGETLEANISLANTNRQNLSKDPVTLKPSQCKAVEDAIYAKSDEIGQKIFTLSACSNHVHIVAGYTTLDLGLVVRYYKMAAQTALRSIGLTGRLWTKGFDKRYCFDEEILQKRIDYVNSHHKKI